MDIRTRRGRAGRGIVVVLAATVLATAASTATYGIAGKAGRHPVAVINKGRGPALVLKNRPAYPPLAVGSSQLVGNLNADLVDGVHAADLEPPTLHWTFGENGDSLDFFEVLPVPSGWYAVDGHVSVKTSDSGPHSPGCFAYPQRQGNGGDYSNVVADQPRASLQSQVSVSGVLFVPPGDRLAFACQPEDGGPMHLLWPATFTARPIHVVDGPAALDQSPMRTRAGTR